MQIEFDYTLRRGKKEYDLLVTADCDFSDDGIGVSLESVALEADHDADCMPALGPDEKELIMVKASRLAVRELVDLWR
jgi:hypothetical protein